MTRHEIFLASICGIMMAAVVALCVGVTINAMNTPTLTELYEQSEFKKQVQAFDAASGIRK